MELSSILIVVAVLVVIGFGFKKLISSEDNKNDPSLSEPRDTNTSKGNQGTRTTRNQTK